MDIQILHLLFNYKGTITSREFRVGFSILFVGFVYIAYTMAFNILFALIAANLGNELIISFGMFNDLISNYVPSIPFGFIFVYSSIVLAVKRIRTITRKRFLIVLTGVSMYLFSLSMLMILKFPSQFSKLNQFIDKSPMLSFIEMGIYVIILFLIVGIINFIYLALPDKNQIIPSNNRTLGIHEYALRLGNVFIVSVVFQLIVMLLITFSKVSINNFFYSPFKLIGIGIVYLLLFIVVIRYSILRLKDAGKSVYWLIGVLGAFIFVCILIISCYKSHQLEILYMYPIFLISFNLLIISHNLLFLLPTRPTN